MAAVRIFLLVVCFAFNGGGWLFDRNSIAYGGLQDKNRGAVIKAAQKEIGVRESKENSGKRVDQYCAYAGVHKAPWCAAFVSWCFGQAGFSQPRTAWSPALFPASRSVKITGAHADMAGMVMGIYFPALGRVAHCGIVESVRGDFLICIEGNTNADGSRNGNGVYRRMRHRRSVHSMADWTRF